ncbi:sensor histidine kinase [Propionivibrio limicola]|uniref:sensor histidine kinase n=1 Tax=Propionivibrio limicola TaxID=167645 RepID=UPI001FEA31F0|nr:ATP-binding protein [Propionivibrio limicola]
MLGGGLFRRFFDTMGIRGKLIVIFVAIKVVPLVLLAGYAWQSARNLGAGVSAQGVEMADAMREAQRKTGKMAVDDAVRALDERSREAIEALTTSLARQVADFLYERDRDVLAAANLAPSEAEYRRFMASHVRSLYVHGKYAPSPDGKGWQPESPFAAENPVRPPLPDNAKDFHARSPENYGARVLAPLFLEMTFVDPGGQEKVKVQNGDLLKPGLRNISRRENTFIKAENYWPALTKLKPGEIYVSEVIGPYVRTDWIGPYTKAKADEMGRPFVPENSGYAGLENPLGKRFRGIARWATPVAKEGKIIGYVTLALDHAHLMAFTNGVRPTPERFAPIADPGSGNYAFIWDHQSRAIAHPRDYFIAGYDPETGEPAPPWMDEQLWNEWKASGQSWAAFSRGIPPFREQSLKRKPSPESSRSGSVGLDCRYLNHSPQCHGWDALTEHGGSGSFVIFFSGLWKLTTAAAIPYYTGDYGASKRGFGYVTIGANVDDFHKAANESGKRIDALIDAADDKLRQEREGLLDAIGSHLSATAIGLVSSTLVMIALVIVIAIWMANVLTGRITQMDGGVRRFREGDLGHRLPVRSRDELGNLARAFNLMADEVQHSFARLDEARKAAEAANSLKGEFLANMSHELRTPLNGILGFAELLENELKDPEQQDYARHIRTSGEHLLELVTDVLDLAKIEAGRLDFDPEPFDLPDFLREVVALQNGHALKKGLRLELVADGVPAQVFADPVRLRQVMHNLLSNALKFTAQGGVTVRAFGVPGNGETDGSANGCSRVRIEVSDTGPGIRLEDLTLIFEKFRQGESFATRTHDGTGLGLTLAKELVEHMDGEIGVESIVGAGSTFFVILPAHERGTEK